MTRFLENSFLVKTIALSMQMPDSISQLEFNSQKQNKVSRLLCAHKASHRLSKFFILKLNLPKYFMTRFLLENSFLLQIQVSGADSNRRLKSLSLVPTQIAVSSRRLWCRLKLPSLVLHQVPSLVLHQIYEFYQSHLVIQSINVLSLNKTVELVVFCSLISDNFFCFQLWGISVEPCFKSLLVLQS